jgi:peptide deformylase
MWHCSLKRTIRILNNLSGAKRVSMTLRPLTLVPDPLLRQVAEPVADIDDAIRTLLSDMAETMYDAPGIGLAAPQVGICQRVIVMDCAPDESPPELWKMVNPEIISRSDETSKLEEGCLSIPNFTGEVIRPAEVIVRYQDETGTEKEMTASGLLAACVQHEIDHLDGILFTDYLSKLKRDMIWRKILKEARGR